MGNYPWNKIMLLSMLISLKKFNWVNIDTFQILSNYVQSTLLKKKTLIYILFILQFTLNIWEKI